MGNRLTRETDRPGGWTVLFNDFIDSVGKITANEKLILLILFRYGDKVFPSLQTVAASSGLSKRTVQRVLLSLEEKGIIRIIHRKGNGNSLTSNEYIVNDYHEMWVDDEQLTIDESKSEELKAIRLLEARGYSIIKTNEPCSAPTTVTEQSPHSSETDNNTEKSKSQEKLHSCNLSIEDIKKYYELDALEIDFEGTKYFGVLRTITDLLCDLLNTTKATIRVEKEEKPAEIVKARLKQLNALDIKNVVYKYCDTTTTVEYQKPYLRTLLYNAKDDYEHETNELYKKHGPYVKQGETE